MFPKISPVFLAFLLTLGCSSPQRWTQFHTNGPNEGFVLVNSGLALQPRWSVNIGPVAYSSPSIGRDGTIYVGTIDGELVGVNPSGTIKWKKTLADASAIVSSPAVGPDNNVYVISIPNATNPLDSTLHSVTPGTSDATINWSRTLGGFTTGSAKTWGSERDPHIFVPVESLPISGLVIFDQAGNVVHRTGVCGSTARGPGATKPNPAFLRFWTDFVLGLPHESRIKDLLNPLESPNPTVAVVDYRNLDASDQPILVVADKWCGIRAFRWNPPNLSEIWFQFSTYAEHPLNIWVSSPAASTSGLVVQATLGELSAYDINTGTLQWRYELPLGVDHVIATPAVFFGRQIYVVSFAHIYLFDDDGSLVNKFDLNSKTIASPAVTANHFYVSTDTGLYTFSFDFSDIVRVGRAKGGLSSPAIGSDGTVYVVTSEGFLQAY